MQGMQNSANRNNNQQSSNQKTNDMDISPSAGHSGSGLPGASP